jgi:hypothetical protein
MTRALEVRSFWGDALLDVQHHPLREGLKVQSSMLEATLASLRDGELALAGARHGALNVLEHEGLTFVMGVVELAPLEDGPREREHLAPACLLAMVLHGALLAAGMASPRSDALSLDRLPSFAPPLAPRLATVLSVGASPTADAAGAIALTPAASGAPSPHRARGGARRAEHPVRPNLLAMLGGVASRLGSGGGGYGASSIPGAPDPLLIPDDMYGMSASRGISCGGPPPGCAASNLLATVSGIGVTRSSHVREAPELQPRDRRDAHVPRIRTCFASCADTRGALSREAVRRVMRRHRNEVTFCYEQAL